MADAGAAATLPVSAVGRNGVGWWGVLSLIATEGAVFAYLLFSYFYLAVHQGPGWIPEPPTFRLSAPNTLILLGSSAVAWWAERAVKRGRTMRGALGLAAAFAMGVVFVIVQLFEWKAKGFSLSDGSYGSIYFVVTGFHMAHVLAGLIALALLAVWCGLGYFDGRRHAPVTYGVAYWHFVDAVWIGVFLSLYVSPYLGGGL